MSAAVAAIIDGETHYAKKRLVFLFSIAYSKTPRNGGSKPPPYNRTVTLYCFFIPIFKTPRFYIRGLHRPRNTRPISTDAWG